MNMSDPITYIVIIVLLGVAAYAIKVIFDKMIFDRIQRNEVLCDSFRVEAEEARRAMKKELLESATHPNDFRNSQEMWQLNFEHTLDLLKLRNESDSKSHEQISIDINAMKEVIMREIATQTNAQVIRIADLADRISKLEDCVGALEKGDKC